MTLPVIVLGGGGHAKVLIDALKYHSADIIGIVDNDSEMAGNTLLGIPVIGTEDILIKYPPDKVSLVNALGSVRQTEVRKNIFEKFKEMGYMFASVVHHSCVIADDIELGEGVQIMAGAIIQPGCSIGYNAIINTHSSIDHDCEIGDHVHIAPGVTLSGEVVIGSQAHIGTGCVAIQGIEIGERCFIGAGSLILQSIPSGVTAYGVPARVVS